MDSNCKIEFKCIKDSCNSLVSFSINEIENDGTVECSTCRKGYSFHPDFVDKMRRFSRLVEAVQDAKDILGNVNVAVAVGEQEVKIPYRLLLTRMNTLITLKMDEGEITFKFRVEPLKEGEVIL